MKTLRLTLLAAAVCASGAVAGFVWIGGSQPSPTAIRGGAGSKRTTAVRAGGESIAEEEKRQETGAWRGTRIGRSQPVLQLEPEPAATAVPQPPAVEADDGPAGTNVTGRRVTVRRIPEPKPAANRTAAVGTQAMNSHGNAMPASAHEAARAQDQTAKPSGKDGALNEKAGAIVAGEKRAPVISKQKDAAAELAAAAAQTPSLPSVPQRPRPPWPRGNFTPEQERYRAQVGWQNFSNWLVEEAETDAENAQE